MESDLICISSDDENDQEVQPRKIDPKLEPTWMPVRRLNRIAPTAIKCNGVNQLNNAKHITNITDGEPKENLKNHSSFNSHKEFGSTIKTNSSKSNVSTPRRLSESINNSSSPKSNVSISHKESEILSNTNSPKSSVSTISQSPIFRTGEVSIVKRKCQNNDEDDVLIKKRSRLSESANEVNPVSKLCKSPECDNTSANKRISFSVDKPPVNNDPIPGCSWFPEPEHDRKEMPQLIVKEKQILYDDEFDLFSTFIEACLKRDSSSDMREIVKKLKKRHERLHPSFLNSDRFKQLLIDKQKLIDIFDEKLFSHIAEVNDEMKSAAKVSRAMEENVLKEVDLEKNSEVGPEPERKERSCSSEDRRIRRKINRILSRIKVCTKRIKQLEEQDVDLNDDYGSSYLIEDKYKRKLVQLWNAYCKYSGEREDAGRAFLRPKHILTTHIPQVDQAIMNFINSKINRRNELLRVGRSIADTVIFPDYRDILNCISQCNEKNALGLSKSQQEIKAKEAFIKIGEHLQRVRQRDYWDTFSLFLEDEDDDPALKDSSLSDKLRKNRVEGKKKMNSLFEEFTKKQENSSANQNDEEEENEEEENEDEDDNNEDEDDPEDEDADASEDKDKDGSESEVEADGKKEEIHKSTEDVDEENKNGTEENNDTESNEENKNGAEENNDTESNEENKNGTEKNNDTDSNEEIDSDGKEAELENLTEEKNVDDVPKISSVNETKDNPTSSSTTNEKILTDENDSLLKDDILEVKDSSSGDGDVVDIDDESSIADKQPLLRLRSFAKPPTSWKDSQGEGSSPIKKVVALTAKASPVVSPVIRKFMHSTPKASLNKDPPSLVDLTFDKMDDLSSKQSRKSLEPGTLPMKNKFKAVMIPSNFKGKQIISVKNITNNYNVVNGTGNAEVIPTRVLTSVSHKMPSGSQTIIRIPSQNMSHLKPRNPLQMRMNKVPEKVVRTITENTSMPPVQILPKPIGSKQIIYQAPPNTKIINPMGINPVGKIVRVKAVGSSADTKMMRVLNLNEGQKVSIAALQKQRMAQKVALNTVSNQVSDPKQLKHVQMLPRVDHQYSRNIVNNVVRILKPGEKNHSSVDPNRGVKKT